MNAPLHQAPETQAAAAIDERCAARSPMFSRMTLSWGYPDFETAPLTVWGLNISGGGAAFISDQPLPLAAIVHLEIPESGASVSGTVTNCMRWGAAWRVGVKFDAADAGEGATAAAAGK
jgi:hypothetical protein